MMRLSRYGFIWIFLVMTSCGSEKAEPAASDFQVENWFTTWEGDQPDYPLTNPLGEVVVIRGQEAKVSGSHFTFNIDAEGRVAMTQAHEDGRLAEFSGTWKGQLEPETGRLVAILCDLSATSTGAYRQYALMADSASRSVMCHGTTKEPAFEVKPTN